MPPALFAEMRDILAAPSPIGMEGAMTSGVLLPAMRSFMPTSWEPRTFKGNAGLVVDTHPGRDDMLKVMICGHADKIRMQVRHVGSDGKIFIDSDSFLPATLLGNEVLLFCDEPDASSAEEGRKRRITGTVEALGAIHFAPPAARTGKAGVDPDSLYIELGLHGKDLKDHVAELGIRTGDPVILDRPIRPAVGAGAFSGAYLDNGLGCFTTVHAARLWAESEGKKEAEAGGGGGDGGGGGPGIRCLFSFASHEEIGRFGSRVLAAEYEPDILIAVDVNHDYKAAPAALKKKNMPELAMGDGVSVCHGAIASEQLNRLVEQACRESCIPFQRDVRGRDTGTDGMAGVLASVDCAATSLGIPIRNMHTISELGCEADVLAACHAVHETLLLLDRQGLRPDDLRDGHVRLDEASPLPMA